jgi:hypothetical protein
MDKYMKFYAEKQPLASARIFCSIEFKFCSLDFKNF